MRIQPYIISGLALVLAGAGQHTNVGPMSVEQTAPGTKAPPELVESLDGLGAGLFSTVPPRNPSDNSLAVGPDHIMQNGELAAGGVHKKGTAL